MELVPSTSYRFAKSAQPVVYVEVYDPVLKDRQTSPRGGAVQHYRPENQPAGLLFQHDSGQRILEPGNPLVPMGFKLPVDQLQAGDYRFEIKGRDEMGNVSTVRSR